MASTNISSASEQDEQAQSQANSLRKHRILIVGGGTGGIAVAAQLVKALHGEDIAILEPSENHYYQPLWTLVGGGVVSKKRTQRSEKGLIPNGVQWIKDAAIELLPAKNTVRTQNGLAIEYEYLVLAPGMQLNWDAIEGLGDGVRRAPGVCSNYGYDLCERTWKELQNFTGGRALFTMPPTPVKCAGAPQKIMYLADDLFRKRNIRDKSEVIYYSGTPGIFSVKEFAATLNKVIDRKAIETHYRHSLKAIDLDAKKATFVNLENEEEVTSDYDFIHITPPQSAPDFVKQSPFAGEGGWISVDKYTLQSPDYPNVFALGDASSLPTSRTGAAVRKQAPVLVNNLAATVRGDDPETSFNKYDGYAACPLVTGYGKLVMAEFDYNLKPQPSFPFDTTKERWSMYQFKRYVLPQWYWRRMMRGRG